MVRGASLLVVLLLCWHPARGQSSGTDTRSTQALVEEVRGLRQDLRSATTATQRAQILLFRTQVQSAAVDRAAQRLDQARQKVREVQDRRNHFVQELAATEAAVEGAKDDKEKQELEARAAALKKLIEQLSNEESELQTRQSEAEQRFREEEAKLAGLEDRLDRLEKTLENSAR